MSALCTYAPQSENLEAGVDTMQTSQHVMFVKYVL